MKLLRWLWSTVKPDELTADPDCDDCYGTGYDGAGMRCPCVGRP